jgi:integrase
MASAGINGTPAMPKGLRHGFGVKAFQSNVPPHLVQRWLGHASLRTTEIYGDVGHRGTRVRRPDLAKLNRVSLLKRVAFARIDRSSFHNRSI